MVFEKERKDKGTKVVVQEAALETHAANDPEVLEQHFALEHEVEALRRQIHALTEQVRRDEIQQPNNHNYHGSEASNEESYEDPFAYNPRIRHKRQIPVLQPRDHEQKWESNFKIELSEFYGSFNHEEFMDWLNQVERIFDFHEVPDYKKVKTW